jgi:hypothetical protein
METFDIIYNEKTGEWEKKEEPFATVELKTEEDFNYLQKALKFYKESHLKSDKESNDRVFDKYGNYSFPTDLKQDGLNIATSLINKVDQISLINDLIFNAIMHGADPGGSYDCNEDGLTASIEKWLNFNGIEGYVIERVERKDTKGYWWCIPQLAKEG